MADDLLSVGDEIVYGGDNLAFGDGARTVSPPLINSAGSFFTPTVIPGAVNVAAPLITDADTVFTPTVSIGAATVSPPRIDAAAIVFQPLVSPDGVQVGAPDLLVDTETVFIPYVSPGAVTVQAPLVDDSDIVLSPTVQHATIQAVLAPFLVDEETVFTPEVSLEPDISVPVYFVGGSAGASGKSSRNRQTSDRQTSDRPESGSWSYSVGAGRRWDGTANRDLDEIRDSLKRAYEKGTGSLEQAVEADKATALLPEVKAAQRAAAAAGGGLLLGQIWPAQGMIDWQRIFADAEMFNFLFDQLRLATLAAEQNAAIRLSQELEQARLEIEAADRLFARYMMILAEEEALILLMAA
jgi:hypothetical protein